MVIVTAIILAALFAVAAQVAMEDEESSSWMHLSQMAAMLAGLLLGIVFTPVSFPWNLIVGFLYGLSFLMMIYVANARGEKKKG